MLCIIMDSFFLDIPFGLVDEVGKEDDFDFVEEKNFTDGPEHFADRVL